MYRIFCESYENFLNSFNEDSYRLEMAKPISLLTSENQYNEEQNKQSQIYKQVSDLLYYMQQNIDKYPKMKAFLWTLESRNMKAKRYNITDIEDLEEQAKLINSFLKLAYWY